MPAETSLLLVSPETHYVRNCARTARAAFLAVDFPAAGHRLTSPRRVDRAAFFAGRRAAFPAVRAAERDLTAFLAADFCRLGGSLAGTPSAYFFLVAVRAADFLFDLAISFCSL